MDASWSKPFASVRRLRRIPFVLIATRTDISEKLRGIQDSVEDLVEKPFFVKDATARVKRVLDKIALEKMARDAPGETVLRGSLAQMNVIDLLQSLEMGRKTCSLSMTNNGEHCELFFSEGQINHAAYGDLRGDDAVYKVLTGPSATSRSISTGTAPSRPLPARRRAC